MKLTFIIISIIFILYSVYKQEIIGNIIYYSNIYNLYLIWDLYDKSNPTHNDLLDLLNTKIELPKIKNTHIIPNRLFQIYMYYKNPIPNYIFENIKKYAFNYKYILFNENQARKFLKKYFDIKILNRFDSLYFGAHKADLLRYCYLYIYGGIYIDIKTVFIYPLNKIFNNKYLFYTSFCHFNTILYNGIIASKPRNILFLQLIWYIINIPLYIINIPIKINSYASICRDIYIKLQRDTLDQKLKPGLNYGFHNDYFMLEEKKDPTIITKDKYGLTYSIYKKSKKIFITRDPKFPW